MYLELVMYSDFSIQHLMERNVMILYLSKRKLRYDYRLPTRMSLTDDNSLFIGHQRQRNRILPESYPYRFEPDYIV